MDYHFEELESTNLWMKQHLSELDDFSVVTVDFQTAGRGQRGNGWESARGENLLMSLLIMPDNLAAADQFCISKVVAVSVASTIESILPNDVDVKIKWPNDIYVNEKKVCGVLIENILSRDGTIQNSIVGIGLNLNQLCFDSDAPNPASVIQFMPLGSTRIEPLEVAGKIKEAIGEGMRLLASCYSLIDSAYKGRLRGFGQFLNYIVLKPTVGPAPTAIISREGSGSENPIEIIEAAIEDVASDGRLDMVLRDGTRRSFYFKEIAPVLTEG